MAVPNIFASNFAYTTFAGVTDVQTIMDGLVTLLTSTLAVADRWTNSPAYTLTSPVDATTGYKMQVVLSRITATRMGFVIKNQDGNTVLNGEVVISSGETIKVTAGPKHLYLWGTSGTSFGGMTLVDPAPEAPNAPTIVVFGKTSHNTGGAAFSFGTLPERWSCFGDAIGVGINSGRCLGPYFIVNAAGCQFITAAGSFVYVPAAMCSLPAANNPQFVGHAYQLMWADSSVGMPARVEVPIDDGVVGIFERIGYMIVMGQGFANQCVVLLARVA